MALTFCADLPVEIPLSEVDRPCRTGVGPSQFDPNRKFWCQRDLIISTGTITLLSIAVFGNNCRRHRNSWLLLTSWRRATIGTDAPGSSVSATI